LRQGDFAQIPFISGNNKDEGTGFIPTAISSEQQIEQVISLSEPTPPDNATINQVLSLYPNEAALGSYV
jgi:carboxylesterase type B